MAMEGKLNIILLLKSSCKYFSCFYNFGYRNHNKYFHSENKLDYYDALVGNLLGDGHLSIYKNVKGKNITARLEFTFSSNNLTYLNYLKFDVYKSICTDTPPTP